MLRSGLDPTYAVVNALSLGGKFLENAQSAVF
ncbi:Hypothetical protein, conserved [Brucella abortus str. 2308 A]|uniref:Uncharacterized protein n=2 Tax=Brucella TaxID=234 RepID=A0A0H3AQV5_BRUO2|nr:hypothetical protein BOV_1618 [Brucella ovis ATCC 25840]EEH13137.1 Hypothetical protein, conserved [Brucella ceti str. Cudo]EEP62927.1 Hypothetical protein, conserved [Brucella abortus str. 2308 A]EFG38566.1 conserved hypothetical protein [Brucella sp. NVSL 07-0026]